MNIGPILRAMKHNRTRVVLIVLEIAITFAIVTNCVNVIIAERKKMTRPSGFDDDNIIRIHTRPFAPEFAEMSFLDTSIDADLRLLASIPGVRAVANTNFQMWEGGGSSSSYVPASSALKDGPQIQNYFATHGIAETLGLKIVAGRGFRQSDHGIGTQPDPANVALITRDAARAMFGDQNPLGQAVQRADRSLPPFTVVGIIDSFYNPYGINDEGGMSTRALIRPARVGSSGNGVSYMVRTEPGAVNAVVTEAERRLAQANPGRVIESETMLGKRNRWFSGSQVVVTTMTGIIIALIVVTALGLLGLTSLAVAERTKQIGTRRALGATRADILRYFLIENWLVTTAGLALGVVGAFALNVLLVSQISDVKMGWQLVVAGMVLLWLNGLASTIPPALRAMYIPPSIATRSV
ncbi:MAG TPA: FtsX-like permease family protein [Thermoanaerobaculia bacterium]|jgi:putative ABC transport system permease protein